MLLERKNNTIWDCYISDLRYAWWEGRNESAERILAAALQEAEDMDELDACLAQTIRDQAELLCRNGKYDQAGRLYQQLLETQEKLLGAAHPDSIGTKQTLSALSARLENAYESKIRQCL